MIINGASSGAAVGDFGLVAMPGNVGLLVRIAQWMNGNGFANYQHAFLYIGDGYVIQAQPGGAVMTPVDKFTHVYWSTGVIALTSEQRAMVSAKAHTYLGTPYSFLDYLALAAHRLRLPGSRLLKNYVSSSSHLICSQLVDQIHNDIGSHLFTDGRWPGYVDPLDLWHLIASNRRLPVP